MSRDLVDDVKDDVGVRVARQSGFDRLLNDWTVHQRV